MSRSSDWKTVDKLIKEQKDKIVQAWLSFAPEKELLRKLITAELSFGKAKENRERRKEKKKKMS